MSDKSSSNVEDKNAKWYWAREDSDSPEGCVNWTELKRMAREDELRPSDLVWREGLEEWIEAGCIEDLFSSPPPLPTETQENTSEITTSTVSERTKPSQEKPGNKSSLSSGNSSYLEGVRDVSFGLTYTISGVFLTIVSILYVLSSSFMFFSSSYLDLRSMFSILLFSFVGLFFSMSYLLKNKFKYSYISFIYACLLHITLGVVVSLLNLVDIFSSYMELNSWDPFISSLLYTSIFLSSYFLYKPVLNNNFYSISSEWKNLNIVNNIQIPSILKFRNILYYFSVFGITTCLFCMLVFVYVLLNQI